MNICNIKKYIERNAHKFEYTALFTMLEKIGFTIDDIKFIPVASLASQPAYIYSVKFIKDKVEVFVADLKIGELLNEVNYIYNFKSGIKKKYIYFFSKILHTNNTSIYPEGFNSLCEVFNNGTFLFSKDDIYIKSFSYIYNYLKSVFSDYRTLIYKKVEKVEKNTELMLLGNSTLSKKSILGGRLTEDKTFVVIRLLTENNLDDAEKAEFKKRISAFIENFKVILPEINIILENYITDPDLYSILPMTQNYRLKLLQSLIRITRITWSSHCV